VEKEISEKSSRFSIKYYVLNVFEKRSVDMPMLVIVLLLVGIGSVMVFSASYAYALARYNDSRYFIDKQIFFVAIGLVAMTVTSCLGYRFLKKFGTIFVFSASLLLLVLVLFIGQSEGEAKRWIAIGDLFSFQPSEIMKLGLVMILALYFDKYSRKTNIEGHFWKSTWYSIIAPGIFMLVACGLIMLENHLSGTIIMALIGLSVIWAGGGKWQWYLVFMCIVVVGLVAVYNFSDILFSVFPEYIQKRVDMWLNPENYSIQDETWQTVQGMIAVGSGGLLGRGLGNSLQKHLFVSQPQNDFIFAIVCEELGFVGAVGVILLFVVFVWRGLYIAKRAPDLFCALTVFGIVAHVAIQAFLNIAVVTAVIPNTGISLPFFSYGGTSLIILMAEMGIVLSISKYSKIQK